MTFDEKIGQMSQSTSRSLLLAIRLRTNRKGGGVPF
jgi:hypothetical protein